MKEQDFAAHHHQRLKRALARRKLPPDVRAAIADALSFMSRRLTVRAHVGCHHCEEHGGDGLPCAWCGLTTRVV